MKPCEVCGREFQPRNPKRPAKTCSRACTNRMVWAAGRARGGIQAASRPVRVCQWCGKEFVSSAHLGRAKAAMFCSPVCVGRAKTKGGVYFRITDGRWVVNLRDGKTKQLYARCLMEGHLGRDLTRDEHVHHINGNRTDDRIENLAVLSSSDHSRLHLAERIVHRRRVAKLSLEKARDIRRRSSAERLDDLAAEFGVSEGTVYQIVAGRIWREDAVPKAILRSQGRISG